MKRTILLLFILTSPVLAGEPVVSTNTAISQTQTLSDWQKQGSSVPTSEELVAKSMAALASARSASIAAAQAWYQWDKGAAAEQEVELKRIHELLAETKP